MEGDEIDALPGANAPSSYFRYPENTITGSESINGRTSEAVSQSSVKPWRRRISYPLLDLARRLSVQGLVFLGPSYLLLRIVLSKPESTLPLFTDFEGSCLPGPSLGIPLAPFFFLLIVPSCIESYMQPIRCYTSKGGFLRSSSILIQQSYRGYTPPNLKHTS